MIKGKDQRGISSYRDFLAPYPYLHRGNALFISTALILLLAFLFENLFEPFNVTPSEHQFSYWAINLIHSGSAAIIFLVFFSVFKNFVNEEKWKVYKELLALSAVLFLIGVGGFLWREIIYNNPNNVSLRYFLEEVRNTYLVGFVLFFAITAINFKILSRKNRISAGQLNPVANQLDSLTSNSIRIKSTVNSDELEIKPLEILYLRSDGNYVEFFLLINNKIEKRIVRLTLRGASKQLQPYTFLVRIHRAYMVNMNYVEDVKGNAQGYKLRVTGLDIRLPVSRSHMQEFNRVTRNYATA